MQIPVMRTGKIPFTMYDFFGYLLPGTFFYLLAVAPYDGYGILQVIGQRISGQIPDFGYKFLIADFVSRLLHESPIFFSALALLIGYITGHVIAALSSLILERVFVEKYLQYPATNMFELEGKRSLPKIFFGKYQRGYSEDFRVGYKEKFERTFTIPFGNPNDIFWLSFEFVAHNCPAALSRAVHFLNLYGFARNLSMTFVLGGVPLLVFLLFRVLPGIASTWFTLLVFVSFLLLALVFFWDYLKLLRRLNDEVYRGFYAWSGVKTAMSSATAPLE